MPIATLIASETTDSGIISDACDRLAQAGCHPAEINWLNPAKAVDIGFTGAVADAKLALKPLLDEYDICIQHGGNRRKMMLISDMDSTMITVECIDELADYAGIKPRIAEITERAMQGELDFAQALRARVKLLRGLNRDMVETCLRERVRSMAGAETLVRTMASWGAHNILVSGGFTDFAGPVARQIGFAEYHANILEFTGGRLTGEVTGEIVDAAMKERLLLKSADNLGLAPEMVLAVGDGANDIPMIMAAGLGVAYHAKPRARDAADFAVRHNDLTALLYIQGVSPENWAK